MVSSDFQRRVRAVSLWFLFLFWLVLSSARLWLFEIDAVREGVFSCFAPSVPTVFKGVTWISNLSW